MVGSTTLSGIIEPIYAPNKVVVAVDTVMLFITAFHPFSYRIFFTS